MERFDIFVKHPKFGKIWIKVDDEGLEWGLPIENHPGHYYISGRIQTFLKPLEKLEEIMRNLDEVLDEITEIKAENEKGLADIVRLLKSWEGDGEVGK